MSADLALIRLTPVHKRVYTHVWTPNPDFVEPWWAPEHTLSGGEVWLSVRRGDVEVARCKAVFHEASEDGPLLDILALEVAEKYRRAGIGRDTLALISSEYSGVRLTALNDTIASSGFWERMGWHLEDRGDMYGNLGNFDPRERGTYIAPE